MNMIFFWAILAGVFLFVEITNLALVSIWCCAAALLSMVAAALNAPLWLQIVIFIVASILFFLYLYPRVKQWIKRTNQPTNADRVLGQIGRVVTAIDNVAGTGTVSVDGRIWTARAESGERIASGVYAEIVEIQGVRLIVRPADRTLTQAEA